MIDQPPPEPKAQPLAPVTQQEILTMLVWSKASRETRRVFENIQTDQQRQTSLSAKADLTGLYRHLEGYSVDDSLGVLILLLEEEHLWERKADQGNEFVLSKQVHNAVEELHKIYAALPSYQKALLEELDKPNSAIQATQRAPNIGRYCPYSVGLWASEKLKIKIHEWLDWSNFYLYAPDLGGESWIEDARDEAHCHVLDRLFQIACGAAESWQLSGSKTQRLFDPSKDSVGLRQSVNVEGWRAFVEGRLDKISPSSGLLTLPRDTSRHILDALKTTQPLLARHLDPFGKPKRDCVHLMIAGLVTGLGGDQFAEELRNAKGANWGLDTALKQIDLTFLDRVHVRTAERIMQLSIDLALKRARSKQKEK